MKTNNTCIDLDDTLVNWHGALREWHNNIYGTYFQEQGFNPYNGLHLTLGISREETQERIETFQRSDYFRNLLPLEGAVKAVDILFQQGGRLIVSTSRADFLKEDTGALIDKYFKNKFSDIFHCKNHYTKRENCGMTKGEVCKKLNASLIDDSLDYIMQCVVLGLDGILFGDYPWNQSGELPLSVKRSLNWKEVLQQIT